MKKYMSLFDYLGQKAGRELGRRVYSKARQCGIKVQSRELNESYYSGKVMLYPISFLQFYFNNFN